MSPKVVATETQRTRLLTALYIVQEQYGHLSDEAIQRVSERLDMHPQEVYSMASFYSLYKTRPTGKYVLQVCEGLSCYLADGADLLIDYLREKRREMAFSPCRRHPVWRHAGHRRPCGSMIHSMRT